MGLRCNCYQHGKILAVFDHEDRFRKIVVKLT